MARSVFRVLPEVSVGFSWFFGVPIPHVIDAGRQKTSQFPVSVVFCNRETDPKMSRFRFSGFRFTTTTLAGDQSRAESSPSCESPALSYQNKQQQHHCYYKSTTAPLAANAYEVRGYCRHTRTEPARACASSRSDFFLSSILLVGLCKTQHVLAFFKHLIRRGKGGAWGRCPLLPQPIAFSTHATLKGATDPHVNLPRTPASHL